jgi:hypothetical protein
LAKIAERHWAVVLHPDAIVDHHVWRQLGERLLIENMDKRKPAGRTADELADIFSVLPSAQLCFDIAHARQVDPSMTEAYLILKRHGRKVRQVHISEVGSGSLHTKISRAAVDDYQEVAWAIPEAVPVILETPVTESEFETELARACEALQRDVKALKA